MFEEQHSIKYGPVIWQNFLRRLIPSRFFSAQPSSPVLHEVIVRTPQYQEAYHSWVAGPACQEWKERLRCAFNMHRAGVDSQDDCIDFLEFRATTGFVMHLQNEEIRHEEASFLLDHLCDLVMAKGYKLAISDRRKREQEVVEKHYLKPPIQRGMCALKDQLYGNITLELTTKGTCPLNLKFITTHYEDRSYRPPMDIKDLLAEIVN